MVARMMRWSRPPLTRKFRILLVVQRAEGLPLPPLPPTLAAKLALPEWEVAGAAEGCRGGSQVEGA